MDPEARKQWQTAMRLGAAGLELGGAIFVGVLVGSWLDERLDTAPWLALGGLLLGSVVGFRALLWLLRHRPNEPEKSEDTRPPETEDTRPPENHD